jgi:H+/Cl- antiporter ClcA
MAVELCGAAILPHAVIVCVLAYLFTGHRSIYPAQRLVREKWGQAVPDGESLRDRATRARGPSP